MQKPYKTLEGLMDNLGIAKWPASWETYFDAAMATAPQGDIPWLQDDYPDRVLHLYGLDIDRFEKGYRACLPAIRKDAALVQFCWLIYYVGVLAEGLSVNTVWGWPNPKAIPERTGNWFLPAAVLLGAHDTMWKRVQARGIEEFCRQDYIASIFYSATKDIDHNEVDGLLLNALAWGLMYTRAQIVRLGRLQFECDIYSDNRYGYRNKKDGGLVVFFGNGEKIRPDGFPVGTLDDMSEEGATLTTLYAQDGYITGYTTTPKGKWIDHPISLPLSDWELVFKPGDTRMAMHIPADGTRMTNEAVEQSWAMAVDFFKKYYPEVHPTVFTGHSWVLSQDLDAFLSPTSNLRLFQRHFYMYPVVGSFGNFQRFLFDNPASYTVEQLREDTSLQRNVKAHVLAGGKMRTGAGLIVYDDLLCGMDYYNDRGIFSNAQLKE
nr:hypothetical protein [bacterium]